jgi:hypothetical protein
VTRPFRCERTAFFSGQVSDFTGVLDPQNWSQNAQEIWLQSYVVVAPVNIGVNVAPGGQAVLSQLPPDNRRADPPPLPNPPVRLPAWGLPNEGLFFEEAMFGEFTYRNLLLTSYADDSAGNPPSIQFDYREYDCLTTEFATGPAFGGVDVDNGFSECVPVPDPAHPGQFIPGMVKISFAKTVRFTQPADLAPEINALATILLPLAFDMWLQNLMF